MKEIILTQNKVALVDDEDYNELNKYNWCAYHDDNMWYARRGTNRNKIQKTILMHREILNAPKGIMIDHINGDGLDNRKENIRLCNNLINGQNRHTVYGTSQYQGVYSPRNNKKWMSRITINKRLFYLGSFNSEKLAAIAYNIAALKYYGADAKINEI
jgi:hypothetical protein